MPGIVGHAGDTGGSARSREGHQRVAVVVNPRVVTRGIVGKDGAVATAGRLDTVCAKYGGR